MSHTLTIELPEEVFEPLQRLAAAAGREPEELALEWLRSHAELAGDLRLLAAVKLYELRRLSSGKAAELAGIPRTVFLGRLAEFGVAAISYPADELERDLANARAARR